MIDWLAPLPRLTADLPGLGGKLKEEPEDFVVEEIPAYLPSGSGEFLYLWVEKRDLGAEYFQRRLAQRLGIRPDDVGMAGLKDRRAVTRQWVSVPAGCEPLVAELEGPDLKVLQISHHGNKLRAGHLHGNRFTIRVRGVDPERFTLLPAYLDRFHRLGFPNYYGEQRFGHDGETLRQGFAVLRGSQPANRNRFMHKLSLSAVQSALFNQYVADRQRQGLLHRVLVGDVMHKWPTGGMFVAENAELEQPRYERHEIVATGPMFGKKMYAAAATAAEREQTLLAAAELSERDFAGFGKLLAGTRRAIVCFLDDLTLTPCDAQDLLVQVSLPAGVYATVLLAELLKS